MKQAVVFLRGVKAGILTEDENGYTFEYDTDYLASANAEAVSLLDIAEKNWKIDARDRMSLLVACCKDCIGAVGVEPIINEEE